MASISNADVVSPRSVKPLVDEQQEFEAKGNEEPVSTHKDPVRPTMQAESPTPTKQQLSLLSTTIPPDLPNVQAWPHVGNVKSQRSLPSTNRKLIATLEDLISIQPTVETLAANFTSSESYNPTQPSMKQLDNPLTLLNVEIPPDYSIEAPMASTIPWSNETTMAYYEGKFYSGFRNQIMTFMIFLFESQRESLPKKGEDPKRRHGQILLRSLSQKDTYGTNSQIPFAKLWDVAHWNSHYPRLPRLVDYDPILHSQFNFDNARWFRTPTFGNDTHQLPMNIQEPAHNWFGTYGLFASHKPMRPYAYGLQHKLSSAYMRYGQGKGAYVGDKETTGHLRNPAEILMLKGAMRPHPDLQAILDGLLQSVSLLEDGKSTATPMISSAPLELDYMTLHARVEPDMQKHIMCRNKKVLNLTDIFDFMEKKWKDPPVSRIFMPINRQYLELEGNIHGGLPRGNFTMQLTNREKLEKKKAKKKINWIAVENLKALNRARDEGLWGGRAKVLEFGAGALEGTSYASKPSTAGAMLNFFIGVPAKIFIGTEVSSFSHDILATRFFRGYTENYKYLPEGLVDWTPPGTSDPPGFAC